jgi:hypothetical protein
LLDSAPQSSCRMAFLEPGTGLAGTIVAWVRAEVIREEMGVLAGWKCGFTNFQQLRRRFNDLRGRRRKTLVELRSTDSRCLP